jgi:hypothetical protein
MRDQNNVPRQLERVIVTSDASIEGHRPPLYPSSWRLFQTLRLTLYAPIVTITHAPSSRQPPFQAPVFPMTEARHRRMQRRGMRDLLPFLGLRRRRVVISSGDLSEALTRPRKSFTISNHHTQSPGNVVTCQGLRSRGAVVHDSPPDP